MIFRDAATLKKLFPPERSNEFFDALFGDATEGAYDISLRYDGFDAGPGGLNFSFVLSQRPGKCLACNLTSGLPEVFDRHPVINVKGLVENITALLGPDACLAAWELGATQHEERARCSIPLRLVITRHTDKNSAAAMKPARPA